MLSLLRTEGEQHQSAGLNDAESIKVLFNAAEEISTKTVFISTADECSSAAVSITTLAAVESNATLRATFGASLSAPV